jgi:hypothetical protein
MINKKYCDGLAAISLIEQLLRTKLLVTYSLIRGIQNCSSRNPVKEQKQIPRQNSVIKL